MTRPKTINKGLFSKKFTQFKLTTAPCGLAVDRRFSDFWWIRDYFQRMYPGFYLPPMAPKGTKNKFDREVIEKRMWYMKEFLLAVCDNPQLRSSPVFERFLSEPDSEKFAKYQKDIEKITNPNNVLQSSCLTRKMLSGKNPPKIEHFINKEGEAHMRVNPDLKAYSESVVLLLKELSPAMTE